LYTCPATSIQFDQNKSTSACNGQGAGYRIFELHDDQTLTTRTHFLGDLSQGC
jgi:Icc protein